MTRVVLLSLAAAGLIYAAYTSLSEGEPEVSTSPANVSEAEIRETPWTKIDPAAQDSPHAIVPDELPSTRAPPTSPIEAEEAPSIADVPGTSAAEQIEHVKVVAPASIREGPSTSTAILGAAQPGANAQVISRHKEWVQIIDPDSKKTGWIQLSFLEMHDQPRLPALSKEEIEAALATPDEVDSLPSEPSKPSVKPRKSQKHGWRNSHRKRGFALRRLFRRAW
ncbi:MAG: SH3 domain-containing protein [Methyloceanibacter sp.]